MIAVILYVGNGNPLSYSGTGTTVTDLTGTQNGTLVNGTSYSSADGVVNFQIDLEHSNIYQMA